jgi:hypothetical protein
LPQNDKAPLHRGHSSSTTPESPIRHKYTWNTAIIIITTIAVVDVYVDSVG